MQGGGKRFNRFHQEAGNPGVTTAISDWPPDMVPYNGLQGDADKNIQGRNQQYQNQLFPNERKRRHHLGSRKLSHGDLVRPRSQANY
jgi:hypothetical protein